MFDDKNQTTMLPVIMCYKLHDCFLFSNFVFVGNIISYTANVNIFHSISSWLGKLQRKGFSIYYVCRCKLSFCLQQKLIIAVIYFQMKKTGL